MENDVQKLSLKILVLDIYDRLCARGMTPKVALDEAKKIIKEGLAGGRKESP